MKIIRLEAENFKRLRAVSVTPSSNVVEVTGDNGSGKTSTLDAIWAALGGKDAVPAKPIRTGEQEAHVTLTIGEGDEVKIKVTRRFRAGKADTLIVESAEGARFSSPQSMLDGLVGALCFDPLAFTREKPAEQVKTLRAFVPDVDFAKVEGLNKRDFDERTAVNRRAKELKARAEAMPVVEGDPPERVDLAALEKQLADASDHNTDIERRVSARTMAQDRILSINNQIATMRSQIEALEKERGGLQAKLDDAGELPARIDTAAVTRALAAGRETNALLDRLGQRKELEAQAKDADEESMALTTAIETRKAEAAKAVAKAKMPVGGLGFGERDGEPFVTLGGEPFDQASQAQKIQASVAIAAAMNPKLRVARILDGSLLDANSWRALEGYAAKHDLQIWVETVSRHGQAAILIEDGEAVSGAGDKPQAPVEEVGDVI